MLRMARHRLGRLLLQDRPGLRYQRRPAADLEPEPGG